MAVLEPPNRDLLTAFQPPTPANMWVPLIISDCVTAPFMGASVHLSNKDQSAHISILARLPVESLSLCRWALLLPWDCRCDPGQLCRNAEHLSTSLIQTIIAWFSSVLECKCSELCSNKSLSGFLGTSAMGSQRGRPYRREREWCMWLNPEYHQFAIDSSHLKR